MATVTVAPDPNAPPDPNAAPAYPIDAITQAIQEYHANRPSVPMAPQSTFLDRLAQGLQHVQAPGGSRGGDAFGANLVAGAAQGFAAPRVAAQTAAQQKLLADYEDQKALQHELVNAKIQGLTTQYTTAADIDKFRRQEAAKEKTHTVTADEAKAFPRLKAWVGQPISQSKYEDVTTAAPEKPTPDEPVLTDQALDARARLFVGGGPEPNFGFGPAGVANKVKFNNRVGELLGGQSPMQIMGNRANVKAETDNITKLTAQRGFLESYGKTANLNADQMLSAANKVVDTGIPFFNAIVRPAAHKFFGNTEVTNFNASLEVVRPEFQRILQAGTAGQGQLHKSEMENLRAMLGNDFTVDNLRGAIAILKQDAANRVSANEDALMQSQKRLISIGTSQPTTTSDPLGIHGAAQNDPLGVR